MNTWLQSFNKKYKENLNVRASGSKRGLADDTIYNRHEGFSIIFDKLIQKNQSHYNIIETGTTRKPNNWKDGNSGFLFVEFCKEFGGFVKSVDIDKNAVQESNNFNDPAYHLAECMDSVKWLGQQENLKDVDLFYLDSYDVKWQKDEKSAEHHLKEFKVIEPFLENCIVAIDDNSRLLESNHRTGKGRMIAEYLDSKSKSPIYDGYQIIYEF